MTIVSPPASARSSRTPASIIAQGIAVSRLNPKGLLILVVMLPQFTSPDAAWPIAGQMGALGLVFTLTCAAVYLTVGASAQRVLRSRSSTARIVSRGSGPCMITIGAAFLVEHFLA